MSTIEDSDSPSIDPLRFVLDDAPDRAVDRSAARVLEVVQIFGDSVTEVRHLARGAHLQFGTSGDLLVPPELVEPGRVVALCVGDVWEVAIDPRWAARRIERGTSTPCGATERLGEGTQLVVEIGAMTLVLREVWRSRRLPVPIGAEVDVPFFALSAALAVVASITGWFGARLPPPSASMQGEVPDPSILVMQVRPPTPVVAGTQAAKTEEPSGSGGTAAGPRRASLDRRVRPVAGTQKPVGILGALTDHGVASVFGDVGLPSAMQTGLDGLHGSSGGGLDGPGLEGRCVGPDCLGMGATYGSGIGDIGPRARKPGYGDPTGTIERSKAPGTMVMDDPILIGSLQPHEIDAVVKRHLSKIRYCYQRELQKTPGLQGKVKIKFTIAKDGTVSSADASVSSLDSPATTACIARTFHQMVFPQPKGGGIAIVSYPFLFAPG